MRTSRPSLKSLLSCWFPLMSLSLFPGISAEVKLRALWNLGRMSLRGWSVGAAAFLAVGFIVWLPKGAVGQTLVEQSAAVGVASDLNSRAGASAAGNLARLKKALAGAGSNTQFVDAASIAPPQGAPAAPAHAEGRKGPATDTAPLSVLAKAESLTPMKGWIVVAQGRVEEVEAVEGRLVYRLVPSSDSGFAARDRLIVEVPKGEKAVAKKGERVRAYGAFASLTKTKSGMRMLFFDEGQIVSGQALLEAEAEEAASSGAVGSFDDPLDGWKLTGTASGLGAGTAVFVGPDEKPVFLEPGDSFGTGFKLTAVRPGEAVLEKGDQELTVIAW